MGRVPCTAWGHAFHGYMAKMEECSHSDCYPAGRPTDYCTYLDAMNKAEMWLSRNKPALFTIYYDVLSAYVNGQEPANSAEIMRMVTATSETRANAFIETFEEYEHTT